MPLYFEEYGDKSKPSIVFIHGGGVSSWMWEKQVEHFKDYHCILPHLAEHGRSIMVGPLSIEDSAIQIAEIIEKHGKGGKAHVVGHSLGGKIIVELLSIRPEIVDHAVVASALFRAVPLIKLSHMHFIYKITVFLYKWNWFLNLTVQQFKFPNKAYEDNCIKEFQKMSADSLYRIYEELYQHLRLPEGLNKVKNLVLVAAGENEIKAMKESVWVIENVMPNAKGLLIKNGVHTYPWALSENFNKLVRSWLENSEIDYN